MNTKIANSRPDRAERLNADFGVRRRAGKGAAKRAPIKLPIPSPNRNALTIMVVATESDPANAPTMRCQTVW